MSYDRSRNVRSHRAAVTVADASPSLPGSSACSVALVGGGVTAGAAYFVTGGCSGQAEATVVVTPRLDPSWSGSTRVGRHLAPVDGTCAQVTSFPGLAEVATALSGEWTPRRRAHPRRVGARRSAWVRKPPSTRTPSASCRPDPEPAPSATVIAMPRGWRGGRATGPRRPGSRSSRS